MHLKVYKQTAVDSLASCVTFVLNRYKQLNIWKKLFNNQSNMWFCELVKCVVFLFFTMKKIVIVGDRSLHLICQWPAEAQRMDTNISKDGVVIEITMLFFNTKR